ncbi:MAG: serine/threonine protein kinase [Planctomycetaceae bacterium]|nr:serine/threonine protein kinase [Planctomycetaceae bacterium]
MASSADSHHGRFLPGVKIDNRYRIVSMVGKGGMGEVYRADDLKLGHTVALKFLPPELSEDPKRLEYFLNEVRLTRQISHPNVCRVYDIGEVDGQQFLSMEYIDGEDLNLLLRRIGKLPHDKGVEIAQQICAGLAAAHEKGVLHRDLKPANIMLDGRGQVRITDFGLAKLAVDVEEGEIAGTPAYMAPEQLTRGQATIQSDLFSLGLILHEIFTGKSVLKPRPIPELMRLHEDSSVSQLVSNSTDIDPVVLHVISQCLEKEAPERPASASSVALALPGGDPLAAAMAAGETPSPEMVAASGGSGLLSLPKAGIYLTIILIELVAAVYFAGRESLTKNMSEYDSPAMLAQEAHDLLVNLDLVEKKPVDEEDDAVTDFGYQLNLSRADGESTQQDWEFWYRQSPDKLTYPLTLGMPMFWGMSQPSLNDPPVDKPGMIALRLNSQKQLRELRVVLDPVYNSISKQESGPSAQGTESLASIDRRLFAAANLIDTARSDNGAGSGEIDVLVERQQQQLQERFDVTTLGLASSPVRGDEYLVYTPKPMDDETKIELPENLERIEIVKQAGNLVYFRVVESDLRTNAIVPLVKAKEKGKTKAKASSYSIKEFKADIQKIGKLLGEFTSMLILPILMILSWRNVSNGRADKRNGWRFALLAFTIIAVKYRLEMGFTLEFLRETLRLAAGAAFMMWLYYLALEPIMRRFWPRILTVWSRAMAGRWRDPIVGQSLLAGLVVGLALPYLYYLMDCHQIHLDYLWKETGGTTKPVQFGQLKSLSGIRGGMMNLLSQFYHAMRLGTYLTINLVLWRALLKNNWWAAIVASPLMLLFWHSHLVTNPSTITVMFLIYYGSFAFLLIRFGIVAAGTMLVSNGIVATCLLDHNWVGPDVTATVFGVCVLLTMALFAFYTSIGGTRTLQEKFATN